jgi:hypothetical protein
MNWLVPAVLAALFASGPASPGAAADAETLTFASLDAGETFVLRGALVMPDPASGPAPAVVILHATGGVDGTGGDSRGADRAERSPRRAPVIASGAKQPSDRGLEGRNADAAGAARFGGRGWRR